MERTIRVTGKGKVSLRPDTIRMMITMEGGDLDYDKTVKTSAERKNKLTKALEELGFNKSDLKTLNFNVNTKCESFHTKDGNWKQVFAGYTFYHSMKLEFDLDSKKLGEVLYVISNTEATPNFSIEYTVKNPEDVKQELLKNAVADSITKAKVLAEAAGVKLNEIQSIDYSWGEIDFVTRPINNLMMCGTEDTAYRCAKNSVDIDIEADDIDVSDTVTVVFNIK